MRNYCPEERTLLPNQSLEDRPVDQKNTTVYPLRIILADVSFLKDGAITFLCWHPMNQRNSTDLPFKHMQ